MKFKHSSSSVHVMSNYVTNRLLNDKRDCRCHCKGQKVKCEACYGGDHNSENIHESVPLYLISVPNHPSH